jgi:hypothetical protein
MNSTLNSGRSILYKGRHTPPTQESLDGCNRTCVNRSLARYATALVAVTASLPITLPQNTALCHLTVI